MKAVSRATVATIAALSVFALGAAQAGATTIGAAHGFKYVQDTMSVSGGGTPFTGSVDCGAGLVVVSGGLLRTGFAGETSMTGNFTTGTHQLWRSAGFNTGSGKNVTTVALCRRSTANVQYVQQKKTLPAAPSSAGALATCPGGMSVASGGVTVQGPLADVHVSRSYPDGAQRAWKTKVVNETGGQRSFWVFAECLPAKAGLTYLQSGIAIGPNPNGTDLDMPCNPGSIPISGGASWGGDQTQAHIASSGPIDLSGGVSSIPDARWRIGIANDAGATKVVTGYAVCAPA